jgi:hypothetical protein
VAFAPSSNLLTTTTPSNPVYAIAAGQGTFSWSDGIHVIFLPATCNLQGSCTLGVMMPSSGIALASDSQGNVYSANLDRTVTWNLPIYPGVQGGVSFNCPSCRLASPSMPPPEEFISPTRWAMPFGSTPPQARF